MSDPILQLDGVSMRYGAAGDDAAPPVLDGVSLTVGAGESLAIVGPSGCGKSTLLNLIGALDRPTAGRITLGGEDLAAQDDEALARLRNRKIGFVFQDHHLLPQCTVLENVLIPTLANPDADRSAARQRAEQLLQRVGLADKAARRPGQLSGGQRQRVAVVRALINQPALILADEPTGALDRGTAGELADLLVELNREQGIAMIVVTHDPTLAGRMAKTFELIDGRLREAAESPAT